MPLPVSLNQVSLTGGFLHEKETLVREITLPALFKSYEQTGRVQSFKLNWRRGEPNEPHIFWDSDIAKWIEGAAYTLSVKRDGVMEDVIDRIVADMAAGQTADGYFNVRYQTIEKANRFTRRSDHELYCAGHLIEAAVAYYRATGKTEMLDIMRRYADHIADVFMNHDRPEDFQTPGHEEIELALVKLYEVTSEKKYLELAKFFIDRRGTSKAEQQHNAGWYGPEYAQDHLPVREQKTAEGHAVRALYLYAGMADIARLYHDQNLLSTCEDLFDNILSQKIYVTGGLGGNYHGESFSYAYDLPNELAYAETCASIAFVFFAQRMFLLTGQAKYMDAAELMLYNAIPAGLSVKGDAFFYTNPLEVHPKRRDHFLTRNMGQFAPEYERPGDFNCSCCPPNVIRLYASVKGYMYHTMEDRIYLNLYGASHANIDELEIIQETDYPRDGAVRVTVRAARPIRKTLYLRIPEWCKEYTTSLPGQPPVKDGYLMVDREWTGEETFQIDFSMPVTELYAHPLAHYNAGRVAVKRGPVVYCAEGVDHNALIKSAVIKKDAAYRCAFDEPLLGGVVTIACDAWVLKETDSDKVLYQSEPYAREDGVLRLIPYAVWGNRGANEMNVWLLKENA